MAGPTPGERRQFGKQVAWIEAPNIFAMRLSGEIDGPSLEALLAFQAEWCAEKDHVFVLCDLSTVTGATIEARRALQGTHIKNAMTHLCVGASFTIRVVTEMVVRAARFMGTASPDMEIQFFETEAEARAYMNRPRLPRRRKRT
ncbi:STAS/SEC14 domain-containing protein [Polyangium sp. y55x31]|uniref:STAS/SEC14 domain-containing protein n=1 Tax=Polyangium sp. y55x31 TaxID=3042688 RepID=UPI00248316DA|nr:STAS/SEC14 domain-containing protein [Polyangium sp. y55x31]MDI1481836.1 STAS/SEC14 domain-containing protein [Polyangium sp. y55x31]